MNSRATINILLTIINRERMQWTEQMQMLQRISLIFLLPIIILFIGRAVRKLAWLGPRLNHFSFAQLRPTKARANLSAYNLLSCPL